MRFPDALPEATRHLADRFSYGVDPGLVADVRANGGREGWWRAQLTRSDPQSLSAGLVPAWFPLLRNPAPLTALLAGTGVRSSWTVGQELIAQTFARRILSRHQVHETMVDFWGNLLYVPASESRSFAWRADYDEQVLRRHALGTYRDLLKAAVVHPAMAGFLTNDLNRKGAINENLGRELLELHTVGRRYSERDVLHASRMLTGFQVDVLTSFEARYVPARHDTGTVRVLGFTDPNRDPDGRAALGRMLGYLAGHPATARRIAHRLCVRFVSDDPPDSIVRSVARAYLRSGTDIRATLDALVRHPEFQRAKHAKAWNPSDDVVHTARVMGLTPTGALTPGAFLYRLIEAAEDMGQVSLRWPRPDGWPETSDNYLSASRVLRSWRHHLDLAGTRGDLLQGVTVASKSSQLPTAWPRTLGELVDHQSQRLVGRPASALLVRAVASAVGKPASFRYAGPDAVPEVDYRLLRGTVLNSPSGLER